MNSRSRSTRPRSASTRTGCAASTSNFARYVDDGRLPGLAAHGQQARQAGARVQLRPAGHGGGPARRAGHAVAHLLDDQADHVGRRDDAVRGGRVRADRPGQQVHPDASRTCGSSPAAATSARSRSRRPSRCGSGTCSPTPPASPTASTGRTRSTPCTGRRASTSATGPGTLAEACDTWARLPLLFQPGAEWNYSVATDVLGRVVEVASGQPLDEFFAQRIFGPLGMTDTGFYAPRRRPGPAGRPVRPGPGPQGGPVRRRWARTARKPPVMLSGGGGLVSTAADYHRFTADAAAPRRTARPASWTACGCSARAPSAYMSRNHLPGDLDLEQFGRPLYAESPLRGIGFGLGFAVVIDPVRRQGRLLRQASCPGAARPAPRSGSTRPRSSR